MNRTARVLAFLIVVVIFSIGGSGGMGSGRLSDPVSMYLSDSTLYVSDRNGIHVFDAVPGTAPVRRAFVPIYANTGIAVKGDVLYANSWGSILALRLRTDGTVDTLKVLFEDPTPVPHWNEGGRARDDSWGWGCGTNSSNMPAAPASYGGSSYAVFAVIDTFLYFVDRSSLVSMSIAQPESPRLLGTTHLNWDLETLFPTERYLFVGATTGMYVLDRQHDPAFPAYISSFVHARACDPVVVRDDLAFVTLRGGNACGSVEDALLSVSLADPTRPRLLDKATPLTPYGLAVSDTALFVGNGSHGLSLYSTSRPESLVKVAWWPWAARDFIWSGSTLYVLDPGGVTAFDVTDRKEPVRLGRAA